MCEKIIKNPYRRVWACVNLDALHDNLRQIAACRKNDAGIIAVIKADGYGHGAVMLAREMDEIPEVIGYAVATEEEAVLLADAGIKKPAMVLGYTFPEAYEEMGTSGCPCDGFHRSDAGGYEPCCPKSWQKNACSHRGRHRYVENRASARTMRDFPLSHARCSVRIFQLRGFLPILRQRMKQINPKRMCSMKNFRALPIVWKRNFP